MFDQTIRLGPVTILSKNSQDLAKFYEEIFGFTIKQSTEELILESSQQRSVIKLINDPKCLPHDPTQIGLYHLALVFSSRSLLANTLEKLFISYPETFIGSADHLVTEAFYFVDPEGNGLELYFDKPTENWALDENGKPMMGNERIDVRDYLKQYTNPDAKPGTIEVGHIHLQVNNIEETKKFYIEKMGLENMIELPTALFAAYDGYHHHLGFNTWQSLGAVKLDGKHSGLVSYQITFRSKQKYEEVTKLLGNNSETSSKKFTIIDPSGIKLEIAWE